MKKVESLTLTILLLILICIQLGAMPIKDTFVSPANTTSGELKLKNNSELNGTDAYGNLYTTNLSENNGKCYDTDGNEVTCQAKGEDVKPLYFRVKRGDGSDGDKDINHDLTIDSSNIDDYDNANKIHVKDNKALTLDDVTIHVKDDFNFDKDAKHDLTIKGNVVIYANHFDLNNKAGINIESGATLKIFASDNVDIGEKSFVDTHGHPEHFLVFAEHDINIKDNKDNDQGDIDGFFYAKHDLHVGKDSTVNGAVAGGHLTEVKENAKINFNSSDIADTDVVELIEDICSNLFAGPASTIDGGELKIEKNVKLKNTPGDGSLFTDNLKQNDGKCYDTDGNEVTCQANGTTALTQIVSVDEGDGSDGDKDIDHDLTIDSSNIDDYDNVKKIKVKKNVALTLDSVTIHANDNFKFNDDADDLTIKGDVVIYAKKFELGKNMGITIESGASLKIYVADTAKFKEKSFIDTGGHPENFVIFSQKIQFDDYKGNKSFEGFFYTDDDFTIGKDVSITGAVVGKKLQIKDGSVIEYDSDAASLISNTGVCTNTPQNPPKNYKFDAWDTFRDINDRNISTKIVGQSFDLTIASLNENGDDYQEFNGTVCAKVDNNITKLDFRDQNSSTASFKISKAIKDVRVGISWKKDVDESCPLSSDHNETNSTDNFAIRPDRFIIDVNDTSPKAGVDFHIDINATGFDGADAKDYNETNGTSFGFYILDSNVTCSSGSLNGIPNPFKFRDGNISFDANYSDVGDVNFSIHEINGSEFAYVDRDDTNDSKRLITPYNKIITVKPYQFAIVNYSFIKNPDQDWRYMADVNESNISISFNVQAQNKMGEVTKKFDKNCYSNDIGVKIGLTSTSSEGNVSYYQEINNTSIHSHDRNLSDFNFSNTINDQNFTEGNSSKVMYALNVYKEHDNPKNPLDINVTEINTTNTSGAKDIGLAPDNNGSSFYYAKLKTRDISTNEASNVDNYIYIDVYSSTNSAYVEGFTQDSLNWYRMIWDNNTVIKELIPQEGFSYNKDVNKSGITLDKNSSLSISNAVAHFKINNSWDKSDSAYIHIKIPSYLWYSAYKEYSFSNGSDCSDHPCFSYSFVKNQNKTISSGHFNGTTIMTKEFNSTKTRKGVKVFR